MRSISGAPPRPSAGMLHAGQRLEQPEHENDDQDEADDAAEPAAAIAAITPAAAAQQQHEKDDDEKRGGRHGGSPSRDKLSNDDLRSSNSRQLLGSLRRILLVITVLPAALLLAQLLRDEESKLERLAGIEARVAMGMVAIVEIIVGDGHGAAGAFGHVLARHLDMNAAGMGAFGLMHAHEALHLGEDHVERAGLEARGRLDGVAMHRVA